MTRGRSVSPCLRVAASLLLLSSCVPVPPELMPKASAPAQAIPGSAAVAFPDVDPGGVSQSTLHFTLRGYNEVDLRQIGALAEDIFNKIGNEIGLYSYLAGQTYTIVVYKDSAEFSTKTKQTAGRAIVNGGILYTYAGQELDAPLAHHLMHLIYSGYMGTRAVSLQWLGEGLAMHQEFARLIDSDRVRVQTIQSNKLRTERMPFSQMTFFAGNDESRRMDDAWHLQTESVVSFMLRQGNSLTFAALLNELRNGADLDHAIADNFPGKFRGAADLETSWQSSL
jgi:hypothetical protein